MARQSRRQVLRAAATAAAALAAGCASGERRKEEAVPQATGGPATAGDAGLDIRHDLHTHTVWSDGAATVRLHVVEARAFELDAVAITDHYTPGSRILDEAGAFDAYLAQIERERAGQDEVIVLKGAEATALDTRGRVTLDARQAARLEWVLCDLGGLSEGTLAATPREKSRYVDNVLRTYLALCDVPYLDAIAHPFNTGNTEPAALPADYPERGLRELAAKMADKGKAFDVMNDTIYWFSEAPIAPRALTAQYVDLVRVFASEGVRFQVGSDDHRTGLGNTRWSRLVLARAGVPAGQIVDPRKIRHVGG